MVTINFSQIGSFNSIQGGSSVLTNPTSIQFGPDGRLYVAEQNGAINAFTVAIENGEYVATEHEELLLPDGSGVVQSIQNHDDDGSPNNNITNRQVTGIVVTGTAENPVVYVSSSDPRIAQGGEVNLDTNSGVITRLTWTGTEWEAVDIVRGLPRSEENHSVNGMVLSPDGTNLYLAVGGNTNNGAPSQFFSYTGEYALSGTVLEIDLQDIESRPILTDPAGGQNGTSRQYVYDLPTLDDPTLLNGGSEEDINGLDIDGPWGGNDGFNMAILPDDAPLRIFADGLRNHYDLVLTAAGNFYTVDNGSNGGLGGDPVFIDGEATNLPNDGGPGDPEPLFLLEDGGYYGHPAPARSNQDLPWTVYNDSGEPDTSLTPNSVPNLADLVPSGVAIADNFIIDPTKFTGDATRLAQSGIRIERDSPESNALVTLGSSSNGLVEFTGDAFDGALQGSLLVTQFNSNVTLLNLSDDGTSLEPLVDPGEDGILGTADDEIIDTDGVFSLITGQSQPLDVTIGPDNTIWVAEFGPDNINVFAPSDETINQLDVDDDSILNVDDPFIRDATNGTSVQLFPGQTLLWDFDDNSDNNLPGPNGYATGLTGVMIDSSTDFEQFFQEPSTLPGQLVKLDNVKFATAAGGGTTLIENVSNGDPFQTNNSGEYLFHTGVTISPTVDTFTINWSIFNPASALTGPFQQIGGYIGTGDQSNYLKLVAIQSPEGEIQILLEDNDVVLASSFIQADGLFDVPDNQQIFFELEIDPTAATATPTITYQTGGGNTTTVSGTSIDLSGTAVLDAILGNYTVQGQDAGLAVGLLSSNTGQPEASTFQAIFNDIEITASEDPSATVLYRVNAGGPEIAAIDGGIAWTADTTTNISPFLVEPGSNNTASFPAVEPGPTVIGTTPGAIFDTERWDQPTAPEMQWAFDTPVAGVYEVRLFLGNGFSGTNDPGERVFDVALEGSVPTNLDDIDLSQQFGNEVGGMITNTVNVTDGTLNIEFLHGVENPLVNGIEIIQLGDGTAMTPTVSIIGGPITANESDPQVQISLLSDITVPSDETVDVTFEIVPGTATPQQDYEYQSATASFDQQTGVYTDTVSIAGGSSDVTVLIDLLQDTLPETDEDFVVKITEVSANAQIGTDSTTVTIQDDDSTDGAAVLSITEDSDNVQISNFGSNSFQIVNTGDKQIAQVEIDVTDALYPDTVFDPFGLAGDTVSKPLTIDTNGGTGIVAPSNASYIGAGGMAGFEAIQLVFDENVDGGFDPEETLGFSVDMDPNSVAGAEKTPLDAGSNPSWDVGGVSGAELIGSTFTVTFADGTTTTGQLQSVGNQAGSHALASQTSPELSVSLTVNGLSAGGLGNYDENGPSVIVNGPAGQTARVVLTKGFIQPVSLDPFLNGTTEQQQFAATLQSQLDELAASDFPANNAVEFQTVDVLLTGEDQDISELFNFTGVPNFTFEGEEQLPLGFAASIIDPSNNDLPLGPVTQPIYLEFAGTGQNEVSIAADQNAAEPDVDGQFTVSLNEVASTDTVVSYTVTGTATPDGDYTALTGTVTIPQGELFASIEVTTLDDLEQEGEESVIVTLEEITTGDSNIVVGAGNTATVTIVDDDDVLPTTTTIEAEDVANTTGYRIENNSVASDGQMLSLVGQGGGEIGTATFDFNGTSGQYNVVIGTFDENDGEATLELTQNDNLIGTSVLDQNPGGNAASVDTQVELTIATGVTIANGDTFTLTGFEEESEHARFDFIRFEPVGDVAEEPPVITTASSISVPENQTTVLDVNATDVNGDMEGNGLTYSLTDGADQGAFAIAPNTGVLSFATAPDFENPQDNNGDNVYEVELTVTDSNNLSDMQLINVTVFDVDETSGDTPILLEAENADSIVNYRTENISVASGNQVLTFLGGSTDETGSATFEFDEASGTYDIVVGTFDENDGLAEFTVELNDIETATITEIGNLELNANLGSNLANAQTAISPIVASGIELTPGDSIIVNGFEESSEHARLDFIQLNPVI